MTATFQKSTARIKRFRPEDRRISLSLRDVAQDYTQDYSNESSEESNGSQDEE